MNTNRKDKPMKWYKLCVYFGLPLSALYAFFCSFIYFLGCKFVSTGTYLNELYMIFPPFNPIAIVFGTVQLALAVLIAITWWKLLKFSSAGPKCHIAVFIINILFFVTYEILTTAMMYIDTSSAVNEIIAIIPKTVLRIIPSVIALLLHIVYYSKRKHLFY